MIDSSLKPLSEITIDAFDEIIVVEEGENVRIDVDLAIINHKLYKVTVKERANFTMTIIGEAKNDVTIRRVIDCVGEHSSIKISSAIKGVNEAKIAIDSFVNVKSNNVECVVDEKIIVNNGAKAVIRMRVIGDRDLIDSSISCSIKGMILGEKASIRAIPELDILSNKIKAKHAVAIARPRRAIIDYFASRGVSEGDAIELLVEKFLCPIGEI